MKEKFESVPGFEEYTVSNFGRVFKNKELLQSKNKQGYFVVCVRGIPTRVHRLVLMAFVGPCPKGLEGSHKDGNKENNNLTNLIWESHADNMTRYEDLELNFGDGGHGPISKLSKEDVANILDMSNFRIHSQDIRIISNTYMQSNTPSWTKYKNGFLAKMVIATIS